MGVLCKSVTVTTSVTQLVQPSPKRTGLILSPDPSVAVTVSHLGTFAVGAGIVLPAATTAQHLNNIEHGELVTGGLNAIATSSTATIGVVEIY